MSHNQCKSISALFLSLILILSLSCSAFATNSFTETKTFTTSTKPFKYDFKKSIEKDGQTYKLDKVIYKEKKKTPVTRVTERTATFKEYDRYKYRQGQPFELNEQEYIIKKVDVEDTTITERRQAINHSTVYGYSTEDPVIPTSVEVDYLDPYSKEMVIACGDIKNIDKTPPEWRNDVSIPIVVYNTNGQYYKIGNTLVRSETPLEDMLTKQDDILKDLSLDIEKYNLTSFSWTSGEYTNEDGIKCRNVQATGARYVSHYTANYVAEDVPFPNCPGHQLTVYYDTNDIDVGKYEYLVEAQGFYIPEEKSNTPVIVGTVAAGAAGCFLLWWFAFNNITFYKDSKRVYSTKIHKGIVKADKLQSYESLTAVISKEYVKKHPKQDVSVISNGKVIKTITIPVSQDKYILEI
ncbi:MAG: hypothetical protein RSB38_00295 [Oscillospiraceae bacterium]